MLKKGVSALPAVNHLRTRILEKRYKKPGGNSVFLFDLECDRGIRGPYYRYEPLV